MLGPVGSFLRPGRTIQRRVASPLSRRILAGEFGEGRTVRLVYTARCSQKGDWENTPVASAVNSGPAEAAVTVDCP